MTTQAIADALNAIDLRRGDMGAPAADGGDAHRE
jgi:hypothetical protein